MNSSPGWQGTVGLGEVIAACGMGCGLALLVAVATGRPGRRRPARRARSAARSASLTSPVTGPGPVTAKPPGPAARERRSDRAPRQDPPEYTWDGGSQNAWRRGSADDWLSSLRNSRVTQAPGPARWPGEPIREFSPVLDYADDGWRTENTADLAAGTWPPEPPMQSAPPMPTVPPMQSAPPMPTVPPIQPAPPMQPVPQPPLPVPQQASAREQPSVRPRGGAHRATGATVPQASHETGPQPTHQTGPQPRVTDRESGHHVASSLPAGRLTDGRGRS